MLPQAPFAIALIVMQFMQYAGACNLMPLFLESVRNISCRLNDCSVVFEKKFDNTLIVSNATCCKHKDGFNPCCIATPFASYTDDAAGIPICGRYLHIPATSGAGLGHWLAEHLSRVALSRMFHLRLMKHQEFLGHSINFTELNYVMGLDLDAGKYTRQQLQASVDRGYMLHKLEAGGPVHDLTQVQNFSSAFNSVWYEWQSQSNGLLGRFQYSYVKQYFVDRIKAQALTHPEYHRDAIVFDPAHTNVVVHIRRGDVTENMGLFRYLPESYYINVMRTILNVASCRSVRLYVISEGSLKDVANITSQLPIEAVFLNQPAW
jgi:hypothetical protein